MVLKFSVDPQTGVVKPPVTVMNGGDVHHSKRSVKNRAVTVFNGGKRRSAKRKTRKSKKATRKQSGHSGKGRKATRRR
jgi:hypothetical protein